MKPFRPDVHPDTPLCTRSGIRITKWYIDLSPYNPMFPIKAKKRGSAKYSTYTLEGRRYQNIESSVDLFIADEEDSRINTRLDAMPDVMRAIRAAKAGDMQEVMLANKDSRRASRDIYISGNNQLSTYTK